MGTLEEEKLEWKIGLGARQLFWQSNVFLLEEFSRKTDSACSKARGNFSESVVPVLWKSVHGIIYPAYARD